MRNMSVKKHHRMFTAKLIVFCVYFVYALITCGCLFRFISCIVYLWLMFLPFTWCYVIMLSNLSGFVNKFSPVDQFLCPLFKKQRCRSFPCKSLYFTHCATWTCLHIHRGSLCELGYPVIGRQGLKVTKKSHFPFNVIFFLPENDISNSVKVFLAFILLYYYFFSNKKI